MTCYDRYISVNYIIHLDSKISFLIPLFSFQRFWHERSAFQRSAFGRSTAGNDVVATIIISLFSFPVFFPFFLRRDLFS